MFIYSDATRLVRGHNIVSLGSRTLRGVRGFEVADLPPALLVVHCAKRQNCVPISDLAYSSTILHKYN